MLSNTRKEENSKIQVTLETFSLSQLFVQIQSIGKLLCPDMSRYNDVCLSGEKALRLNNLIILSERKGNQGFLGYTLLEGRENGRTVCSKKKSLAKGERRNEPAS